MTIDWFTFAAQIVNFLVLLALLRRFLYQPVLGVMRRRREEIEKRLDEAASARREAEEQSKRLEEEKRDLEEKRNELLEEAREEAQQRRRQLLDEARSEVEEARERWRRDLQREREAVIRALRSGALEQGTTVARRCLEDLASADLEAEVVDEFLKRMDDLPKDERDAMANALQEDGEGLVIRSAHELSEGQRNRLAEKVCLVTGTDDCEVRFETDSDLVLGLELEAHGRMLGWSADKYLEQLAEDASQESVSQLLETAEASDSSA